MGYTEQREEGRGEQHGLTLIKITNCCPPRHPLLPSSPSHFCSASGVAVSGCVCASVDDRGSRAMMALQMCASFGVFKVTKIYNPCTYGSLIAGV